MLRLLSGGKRGGRKEREREKERKPFIEMESTDTTFVPIKHFSLATAEESYCGVSNAIVSAPADDSIA